MSDVIAADRVLRLPCTVRLRSLPTDLTGCVLAQPSRPEPSRHGFTAVERYGVAMCDTWRLACVGGERDGARSIPVDCCESSSPFGVAS